ncbi:hypothetical protein [Burkholderia pseudomallei]|uniref:hypothetical protein n=1 Tax=Burkholderia pseudomallei TaxID=28450 RepID=UPI0004F90D14|nr:hypothetical protein [Burkholderia pseudomallei]AIP03950.1 hypothetical protein DP51_1244 [Burkholderia pseudomallei]UZU14325.1 hypothetical protein OSB53_14985 [Burkholderia pseudomallei]UZU22311.1 hypothetical protein OSB35_24890 [Burkholderia pseudomallei]UZU30358.1 hypothetical protein OSB54_18600 [Burkholderia pseudomallei]
MEILEAYCEELGRVVDIYEAQEEYFALPPAQRNRFKFRCSDPTCRAERNPLVVGANYDKDAETSEKYQQAHFRTHSNHPHIEHCVWQLASADVRPGSTTEGGGTRSPRAKATNVVDVFSPRHADTLPSVGGGSSPPVPPTSTAPTGEGGDGGGDKTRTGITTTSRLEKLVDCWAEMEHEERREHQITINGQTLSYRQLCLHATTIRPEENGTRVVCGGARVKSWPDNAPSHYFVNFLDDCECFEEASGDRSLTISLPIKQLKQSRRGALLISRIEQASKPNHYLRVYAWGEIKPRARAKGYELTLEALDNLVLKAIESKSAKSSKT